MDNFKFMQKQILLWRAQGLISDEQASTLAAKYEPKSLNAPYLTVRIIASLFALVAAVLFIAHNWDELALLVRFGVVLAVLAGVQGVGLFFLRLEKILHARAWLFLSNLLFGAAITLVAQIFHLGEHMSDGILAWSMAPLAFGAIFGWAEQVALSIVLCGLYMGMEFIVYNVFSLAWMVFLAVGAFWYFSKRNGVIGVFVGIFLNLIFALYIYHIFRNSEEATLIYLAGNIFLVLAFYKTAIGQVSAILGTFWAFLWYFFDVSETYIIFDNTSEESFSWIVSGLCVASIAIALKRQQWILGVSAVYLLSLSFGVGYQLSPLVIGGITILLFVLIGLKAITTNSRLNNVLGGILILAVAVSEYFLLQYDYLGTSLIFLAMAVAVLVFFRRVK